MSKMWIHDIRTKKIKTLFPEMPSRAVNAMAWETGKWTMERLQESLISGAFHPKFGKKHMVGYGTYLQMCKVAGVCPRGNNRKPPTQCPHCGKPLC